MAKKPKKLIKKTKINASSSKEPIFQETPIMRLRKLSRRQSKTKHRKTANQKKLPAAWKILWDSIKHLYRYKKLFLGVLAIYAIMNILFVKGLSGNFQLETLRRQLSSTFGGQLSTLSTGIALFGLLIGSSSSSQNESASAYQTLIVIIISLALIWGLRRTYGKPSKLRIRDAFYQGMYPLVPLFVVLFFILLQLIPFAISSSIYSIIQGGGLAVTGIERFIFLFIFVAGLGVSVYFLSSSIFAFYIVTIPNIQPRMALKQARKLVKYRRLVIIRKLLFLPVALLVFAAAVLIPMIIIFTPAAEILFFVFTILVLAVFHSYMYTLYRELL